MKDLPAPGAHYELQLRFSQADFDVFARISGDHNPIHVDSEFSAQTRFGATVAHGMFIFGHFAAAAARWLGGPIHVLDQRLTFTAPTFAEDDLVLQMATVESAAGTLTLTQQLLRSDGTSTAAGTSVVGHSLQLLRSDDTALTGASPPFKGIEVGMTAAMSHVFTADDVSAFRHLVDDPNPLFAGSQSLVPPALIGGAVSCLLGMELPGPGTNWLKQRYRFFDQVSIGEELLTSVEVSRLRPAKALVNLHNAADVAGRRVMSGETLVLAADVAERA